MSSVRIRFDIATARTCGPLEVTDRLAEQTGAEKEQDVRRDDEKDGQIEL